MIDYKRFFALFGVFIMPLYALDMNICCTSLGTPLGKNAHTIAYSNCHNDYDSAKYHQVVLKNGDIVTSGLEWQCVEYARRWLINERGITFDSIDHAYQIWDLSNATNLMTNELVSWHKYLNANTPNKPKAGDLLIYDLTQGIHGHVSVIVKVAGNKVYIAEQNYTNLPWDAKEYARVLSLQKNSQGHYFINDLGIIGWMRIKL